MSKITYQERTAVPESFPAQHQAEHPGSQQQMNPKPIVVGAAYKPAGKLAGRVMW